MSERKDKRVTTTRPEVEILLRNVPRHIRDNFKAWCVRRGTNMSARIVKFMRDTITGEQAKIEARQEKARLEELRKSRKKSEANKPITPYKW